MAKKEQMLSYRVVKDEMVTYEVLNNRAGANTKYKMRRLGTVEGGWFGERSDRILWTKAEAKAKAIADMQRDIDWHTKTLAEDKKKLKKLRALKVK